MMNKKLLAVAVSSALAVPMAAHAVKYAASGQVNRAVMFVDDGQASDVLQVDGAASNTRFRFTGSEDIGNGMKVGFTIELSASSNSSSTVTMKQADSGFAVGERHQALYFQGNWGKVTMGQTSGASDGAAFADLSASWFVTENAADYGGGIIYRTSAGGVQGASVGASMPSYDGNRRDTLRYDSPALGPVKVALSVQNDNEWDAAVSASGAMAGGEYDARFGYRESDNRSGYSQWAASGAFKFSQGTSINLAYGERDRVGAGIDSDYFYVKLGHDWGNNGVAVHYKSADDSVTGCAGSTQANGACGGTNWGVGFSHTMPKPKVDLYAGYNNYELDNHPTAEDVDVFVIGSRVRFD